MSLSLPLTLDFKRHYQGQILMDVLKEALALVQSATPENYVEETTVTLRHEPGRAIVTTTVVIVEGGEA